MRLAIFGDSLSDPDTYSDVPDECWTDHIERGPFAHTVVANHAVGGAVSGPADAHAYNINGQLLEVPGVLGQIDDYINGAWASTADTHILWPGNNDLILACQLDPFDIEGRGHVTPSHITLAHRRASARLTDLDYRNAVISDYTLPNIAAAIDKLKPLGHVVVVGPFALASTPLGRTAPTLVSFGTRILAEGMKDLCRLRGVRFVDLRPIRVGTIDVVHLNDKSQREVARRIVQARY